MKRFSFKCSTCGHEHVGLPAFDLAAPAQFLAVPESERAARVALGSDDCVIDEEQFFVRAQLRLPIHDCDESLVYGMWLSLSRESFARFIQLWEQEGRQNEPPRFAWLCEAPAPFPPLTEAMKARLHFQLLPLRPLVELERSDHPLSLAFHSGLQPDVAARLVERLLGNH